MIEGSQKKNRQYIEYQSPIYNYGGQILWKTIIRLELY